MTTGRAPNGRATGSSTRTRTRCGPAPITVTFAARRGGNAARAAAEALVSSPPIAASLAASRAAPWARTWSRASPRRPTMARVTATNSGIAAASSTVTDPSSGRGRPPAEGINPSRRAIGHGRGHRRADRRWPRCAPRPRQARRSWPRRRLSNLDRNSVLTLHDADPIVNVYSDDLACATATTQYAPSTSRNA